MWLGALDIGGTKTMAAVVAPDGNIAAQSAFSTSVEDCERHFVHCRDEMLRLAAGLGLSPQDLGGVGIAVPGMADPERGVLLHAPYAGWRDVPIRDRFRELLGIQAVFVENDVKACALGELRFGWGQEYQSFVWVTVSTGIGAAVTVDGALLRGTDNLAGELGHVAVEYDRPPRCSCGKYGCLEACASGTGITASVRAATASDAAFAAAFLESGLAFDAAGCAVLARQGHPAAVAIYKQAGLYLARGFATAINLLNPQAVIVGGGVAASLDLLHPVICRYLREYAVGALAETPVLRTRLGYEAALRSAAALVRPNLE